MGEREWKGSVELTMGLSEFSAAAPETSTESSQDSPAVTTPSPMMASMGDGGLIFAIVAIGCVLGAFAYRYRVY